MQNAELDADDALWQEFVTDDGLEHAALAATLGADDDDARQLERLAVINALEDGADLDELAGEKHEVIGRVVIDQLDGWQRRGDGGNGRGDILLQNQNPNVQKYYSHLENPQALTPSPP